MARFSVTEYVMCPFCAEVFYGMVTRDIVLTNKNRFKIISAYEREAKRFAKLALKEHILLIHSSLN